ncbi:serine/threonine-protein kinase [Duncaniella dubosii]|uniref:serine/threonine-protein kinase n=1 Tax=Duncaniella dubosii TaxID=2518971 RepID=UPI0023F0E49D|nr:serine/threonine-protein kinase [Duncaniella dubosii]MCX4284868.1 serine/threonine-protein kinase [Duncaniella dubosii]
MMQDDIIKELYETGLPFDGRYKLIRPLSTAGGSADVWLAMDTNTLGSDENEDDATRVAIKIYRPKNIIDIEGEYQFRSEFKKVFGCHHANIIQPTYFSVFQEMPYLVLPFCSQGSSEKLICQLTKAEDLWKYIYEVACGLAYLHERTPQIVHQDIKPANVLVDDNGTYAITDFGISAAMGGIDVNDSEEYSAGTFAYMAPERFVEGTHPMPESDMWSFGATLFELISGDTPFGNDGGQVQQSTTPLPIISSSVPEDIRRLVSSCLAFNPEDRPSAQDIVDLFLKRRYAGRRKLLLMSTMSIVILCILVVSWIGLRSDEVGMQLDTIYAGADSMTKVQVAILLDSSTNPSSENIRELEKAAAIFGNIGDDAPDDYIRKSESRSKQAEIQKLIEEIRQYERAATLARRARMADMTEEHLQYSMMAENHRTRINQLTRALK